MKFSIIIPAFKDTFFDECIQSCLSQTYPNFELIIVNDNSPYDIDNIVQKYKDLRIKYYRNNKGYGAEHIVDNWNHCIEYASGDFLICMGDDDKLKPNCLQDYVKLITMFPGREVYHTRMEIIDEYSCIKTIQEDRPDTESVYSMIWHFWHGRRQVIGDWCFNLVALKEKGGFVYMPYGWSSDNLTAFKYAISKGVANQRETGFQYRESSFTITNCYSIKNTIGKIIAWKNVNEWYLSFLQDAKPKDKIDIIYYNDIVKMLPAYIERKIEGELEHAFNCYPYSFIPLIKCAKTVNIPLKFIFKILIRNIFKKIH